MVEVRVQVLDFDNRRESAQNTPMQESLFVFKLEEDMDYLGHEVDEFISSLFIFLRRGSFSALEIRRVVMDNLRLLHHRFSTVDR